MDAERPLLTVLAVCYNHAPFLNECLESIRAQTYQDFELVITDDGSTDGSADLIRKWIEEHGRECRFIAHASNQGLCRTLNEALAAVRGKYLARISTDDVWLPRKLERQLAVMESLPERVAVLYGDADQIRADGELLPQRFLASCRVHGPGPSGDVFLPLLHRFFVLGVTTLLRTDCVRAVGGYDETLAYEDWDLWLRLAERYEFHFHDEIHAKYRRIPTSLSSTLARARASDQTWSDVRILEKFVRSPRLDPGERARTALRMAKRALRFAGHADARAVPAMARAVRAFARAGSQPS
jgi:glycosyltransferase involved in cell wall biosynthesis